ncbi:MAG: hypothetical protein MHM6MM_005308 [Cercozoa sp. M6MM]
MDLFDTRATEGDTEIEKVKAAVSEALPKVSANDVLYLDAALVTDEHAELTWLIKEAILVAHDQGFRHVVYEAVGPRDVEEQDKLCKDFVKSFHFPCVSNVRVLSHIPQEDDNIASLIAIEIMDQIPGSFY